MNEISVFDIRKNDKGEIKTSDLGKKNLSEVIKVEDVEGLGCIRLTFVDGTIGYIYKNLTHVDEEGKCVTSPSPERVALIKYLAAKKAERNNTPVAEANVPAPVVQTQDEFVETNEDKKNVTWLKVANGIVVGVIGGVVLGIALRSCGDSKTVTPTVIETNTDDHKEDEKEEEIVITRPDQRYTEITSENFEKAVNDLLSLASKNNAPISKDQAEQFVLLANINHLEQTNPELLAEKLGDLSGESLVQNAGEVIGAVVTSNYTKGIDPAPYVIASLIDNTDKDIAKALFNVRSEIDEIHADYLEYVAKINENPKMTNAQKVQAIDELLEEARKDADEYVNDFILNPYFDPSNMGYKLNGTEINEMQTDGAQFVTTAVLSGVYTSDPILVQYVVGRSNASMVNMGKNAGTVPNIFTIVNRCQNNGNGTKTYQKTN